MEKKVVFTTDNIFFSTVKEEVVEREANKLIEELIKKSSTYLEEGLDTKVDISIQSFMDTYNSIMSIKVRAFEEIVD